MCNIWQITQKNKHTCIINYSRSKCVSDCFLSHSSLSLSVTLAFLLLFCLLSIFFSLTGVDVPLDGLLCLVCMVKVPTTAPMLSPWKPAWSNKPQRNNSPLFVSRSCQAPSLCLSLSFSASTAPLDLKEGFHPPLLWLVLSLRDDSPPF